MTPYVQDADFTLYRGDALEVLRELPDASVDCAACSPPFYGLRDYGVDGQIGLEADPSEWCARLVDVFRELRRVLVKTGTLWIECGDSYGANQGSGFNTVAFRGEGHVARKRLGQETPIPHPYKPKDLIGAPFLLAFALRADGWWWRSTNIWHKPNCLPESATDRPTVAHSYVFQFSKSARYFHNAEAVREPAEWAHWGKQTSPKIDGGGEQARGVNGSWIFHQSREDMAEKYPARNLRSVWTISTQGFPDAHFATWPEALVERIIKMACPEWVCRVCGVAREPITEVSYEKSPGHGAGSVVGRHEASGQNNYDGAGMPRLNKRVDVVGLSDCGHGDYRPGIIADIFLGSGTTALVARRLGRACVGIELNESYCAMAADRLSQLSLLAEPA